MKKTMALLCTLLMVSSASAAIIADSFEVDSSADYTVVSQGGTAISTFAYDYVSAGIPLAPNSTAGDMGGLRFIANTTPDPANPSTGLATAITAFHNTQVTGMSSYTMQVDMYIGFDATGSGTTEHAHIGVAGDGATVNQLFSPVSGSGHYVAITGDGGSSSDYRHYTPSGLTNSGDPSYLNDLNTTNSLGDTYMNLFPSPPYDIAGSPGNAWTTLTIEVTPSTVSYYLTGATGMTKIIETATEGTDGYVSLGHGDLFTSLASPVDGMFALYDNLIVTPEPGSLALLGLGVVALARRRR